MALLGNTLLATRDSELFVLILSSSTWYGN